MICGHHRSSSTSADHPFGKTVRLGEHTGSGTRWSRTYKTPFELHPCTHKEKNIVMKKWTRNTPLGIMTFFIVDLHDLYKVCDLHLIFSHHINITNAT